MPLTSRRNLTMLLYATTAILTIWLIFQLPGGKPLTTSRVVARAIRMLYVYMVASCFDRAIERAADVLRIVAGNRTYWAVRLAVLALALRLVLRFDIEGVGRQAEAAETPKLKDGGFILAHGGRALNE